MKEFKVWTNVTEERAIKAEDPREAVSKFHETVGQLPDGWDGALHVRDEQGEEWSYQRRQAA